MVLVGEIFVRHVARVAAEGDFADGIDAVERDRRQRRVGANRVVRDQPFAGDDQLLRRPGQIGVGDAGAADSAISEAVGFMDVDDADIGIEGGDGDELIAGEGADDFLGRAVADACRCRASSGSAGMASQKPPP